MTIGIDTITVVTETTSILLVTREEIKIITIAENAGTATKTTVMYDGVRGNWRTADIITEDVPTPTPLGHPRPTAVGDRRLPTTIEEADLHLPTTPAPPIHQFATTRTLTPTAPSTTAKASPQTNKSPAETPHRQTTTPEPTPNGKPLN